MTIKKFVGKTQEDAIQKAKQELGPATVIMNVKEIRPTGLFKAFKSSSFEVTAAIEEKEFKMPPEQKKINLSANEDISSVLKQSIKNETEKNVVHNQPQMEGFEERLVNLQSLLEERLTPQQEEYKAKKEECSSEDFYEESENVKLIKLVYNTLLDNEIDEKYANQLMNEIDKSMNTTSSIDMLLANIYQKMILKFGQPSPIDLTGIRPKVIFFIGPTGVGKTTTIAKIASKLKVESGKKIALFTADTYRIAAEEQLRTYANILDTPLTILYSAEDLVQAVIQAKDADVILVDTAGFSHKSIQQKEDTKHLIDNLPVEYPKEVYLVLSSTTKYRDLIEIVDSYREIADYKLIFTKLDETSAYGNLYNIKMYTQAEMSYVTIGQNVPDDIAVFDTQQVVKRLLGGK